MIRSPVATDRLLSIEKLSNLQLYLPIGLGISLCLTGAGEGRVGRLKARWLVKWHVPQAMDEISAPTPQIVWGKDDQSVSARLTKEIGYGRMEPSKAGRTNLVITVSGSYAIIIHHFSNSDNPSRAG